MKSIFQLCLEPTRILFLLIILISPSVVSAATTGAIIGQVTDADGNPVIGATILVEGSQFGTMSNQLGEYYIAQLAPGSYTITARMVGMSSTSFEGVTVLTDQTTKIDLVLEEEVVGETVVHVTGQRQLILEDIPSTIHVVDRTEISTMSVASILDVIERQAGVSVRGGEVHVRGGRSGEVAFLLNGVSVRSPVTNAFISVVPLSAIAEASTTTGGFEAEHGNALSGIVEMTVREGGQEMEMDMNLSAGSMTAFTSETEQRNHILPSDNDNYRGDCLDGELSIGGPDPITGILLPSIGIRIPGEMRFFGAAEWSRSGFNLEDSRGNWENNWQNNLTGCLNLNYRPEPLTRLGFLLRYSYRQGGWDEWAWSRFDQPVYIEGEPYLGGSIDYALPIRFDENWGLTWRGSRMFGESSLLEIMVDRSEFCRWWRIRDEEGGYIGEGLTPAAWFGAFFSERAADSLGFYHSGVHPAVWLESRSSILSGRVEWISQLNRTLRLKTGVEGALYDIYDFSVYADGPGEVWVNNWNASPRSGAAFVQSSADFSGAMVLNTGIRLDMFDPNTRRVVPGETGASEVPIKYSLSPRIGFTHPISDRDVFFAMYGYYSQMPDLNQLYCGTSYNLSGDYSIVGNPDLEPVKTISYEAGVRHRLDNLSTLSISAYHKQITGLIQTTPQSVSGLESYFVYENDDSYATVQGMEMTLMRLLGGLWSGSLSYTYSMAEGRYSSATEQFEYSAEGYSVIPSEESYLDWDQRHAAAAALRFAVNRGEGPLVGSVRVLEGSAISLDWNWGSGYPFSAPSSDSLPLINTMRYPWTMQTDLSVSRRLWIDPFELEMMLTVYNLFDRSNVVRIFDPEWYLSTGDAGGIQSNPAAWAPARHFLLSMSIFW